jgi:hypothetical protein
VIGLLAEERMAFLDDQHAVFALISFPVNAQPGRCGEWNARGVSPGMGSVFQVCTLSLLSSASSYRTSPLCKGKRG